MIEEDTGNVEREIADEDGMAWKYIPTEVASDLIYVSNREQDGNTLIEATRCLALDITIDREGGTKQMLMAALVWDSCAVH